MDDLRCRLDLLRRHFVVSCTGGDGSIKMLDQVGSSADLTITSMATYQHPPLP